ncbi:MAG TPA: serine hydrolase domain-containing protein [Sphingomonas sp.]|nr:serine hydrolase domain-containing protein [Sphingomonas sp.]
MQAGGLADRATGRAVSASDPVRIASISKLVTAIAVMRMVEAGTLDLDADISTTLGYRVRNPEFPDRAITLRLLLSHRSSLRDAAGYVVPLGSRLSDTLTDPRAWDGDHPPGTWFQYTNLNFPVIASVMERVSGERFDLLMSRLVLAPLQLDACFNWPTCSDEVVARAVVLYDASGVAVRDDLHGQRPECDVTPAADGGCDLGTWAPGENGALFSPQGGLRISMRDLAIVGRMIARGGEVNGVRLLSPTSVAALARPEWTFDGANGDTDQGFQCRYGLAMQTLATRVAGCKDDPFGDGVPRIGHAGEAYGLRSGLWIDPVSGRGVAYFTTMVPDGVRAKSSGFSPAEEAIARR